MDVDGTLVDKDDEPRPFVAEFFRRVRQLKNVKIVVWSAGLAGSRGAEFGQYAKDKIAMIDRKLRSNIQNMVNAYLWKGTKFILAAPQFYVDDDPTLLEAKKKMGHGTFQVPSYDSSVDVDGDDHWLLNASRAIEDFVWMQ
jgi:hypothetical protein